MALARIVLPWQLSFLLTMNLRYKGAYGGRASSKSTSFAKALIVKASESKKLVLCTREIQNSILESVYKLLVDQIKVLGVESDWTWTKSEITCTKTGSRFLFKGLRTDVDKIKSMEGVDICWVEEADKVSDESWEILIPTVRNPNSEIWFTFNTGTEEDACYKRFVINSPPDCKVVKLNYVDIPQEWLSPEIIAEANYCKASDPSAYEHIWLGSTRGGGGRIWSPFNPDVHVKDFAWDDLKVRAQCYMAMDPHSKYFPACVWIAKLPLDNGKESAYYVYNEWPTYEMFGKYYSEVRKTKLMSEWGGIRDLSREIQLNDGQEYGLKIEKRFIDTRFSKGAGGENWSTSTMGVIKEFSQPVNGGLHFTQPPERLIDIQREKILDKLRFNTLLPQSSFNQPQFYIAPWCKNTIQSFKFHRLMELSEREDDKYKDFSDSVRICAAGMGVNDWQQTRQQKVAQANAPQYEVSYAGANSSQGWMG